MAAAVDGATTVSDWRRALDLVQQRHPLLSARIERNGENRPCFSQDLAAPIPLRVVQGTNVTQRWEFQAGLELSIPFDPTKAPLLRAVLLHEEQRAVCLVVIHHAVADGRSVAFVFRDLLQALSGKPVKRLPLIPSFEDTLGITSNDSGYVGAKNEPASSPIERRRVLVKEQTLPGIRTLSLTTDMTSRLRERAREEGTTVHGALSSAFALACWEVVEELRDSPIRMLSPIDARKSSGLGEDCALLVGSGTVSIGPGEATTFWEIARAATTPLRSAQTLAAIRAARHGMFQVIKQGVDVSTVADIAAQRLANDIVLTNLGDLGYPTDFGKLQLKAVWGPIGGAKVCGRTHDWHHYNQWIAAARTNDLCASRIAARDRRGDVDLRLCDQKARYGPASYRVIPQKHGIGHFAPIFQGETGCSEIEKRILGRSRSR
ncbi:MAG: condensation domain-containing protein [Chthoniobacterales bacterium]